MAFRTRRFRKELKIWSHNLQRPGYEQFRRYVQQVTEEMDWDILALQELCQPNNKWAKETFEIQIPDRKDEPDHEEEEKHTI